MTTPEDKRKARTYLNNKWDSQNTRRVTCKFMIKSDAEVLKRLDRQTNKTDYIRQLILKDIQDNPDPQ